MSTVFPAGAQSAVSAGSGRAYVEYDIPESVVGFVALVTISANPSVAPSAAWAAVSTATYIVSMTSGLADGSFQDSLSFTPLAQSSLGYPPPSITSVEFVGGGTGETSTPATASPTRSNVHSLPLGGRFRITFSSGGTSAANALASIQPMHVVPVHPATKEERPRSR